MMSPLWLSIQLAFWTTALLLAIAIPIAYWLAFTRLRRRLLVEVLIALPLVLPPTVIGFYLLLVMGRGGWLGGLWESMTGSTLAFSFSGILLASLLYSLPFAVQPIQIAFEAIPKSWIEEAKLMGASRRQLLWHVLLPNSLFGVMTGAALTFAHTLGEFGIVLMIGGNIPGETRTVAIAIYDLVESLDYQAAHWLCLTLLGFSFGTLLLLYGLRHEGKRLY